MGNFFRVVVVLNSSLDMRFVPPRLTIISIIVHFILSATTTPTTTKLLRSPKFINVLP